MLGNTFLSGIGCKRADWALGGKRVPLPIIILIFTDFDQKISHYVGHLIKKYSYYAIIRLLNFDQILKLLPV